MKLKYKFTFLTSLIFLLLLVIIYIVSYNIIMNSFLDLEEKYLYKNLERVNELNTQELEELDKFASDWGLWDDTYFYVNNEEPDYIEKFVTFNALSNLELDFIIFSNSTDIIYSAKVNYESEELSKNYEDLENKIIENKIIDIKKDNIHGIIKLNEGPAYFSSKFASMSDGSGEIKGKIIGGKFIKNQEEDFQNILKFPIIIENFNEEILKDFKEIRIRPSVTANSILNLMNGFAIKEDTKHEKSLFIKRENDKISSFEVLKDINNIPVTIIEFSVSRDIYSEGLKTLNIFLAILLIFSLITIFIIFILNNLILKDIVRRINQLKNSIDNINKGNYETNIDLKVSDEVGDLAKSFKEMSENLKNSNKKIDSYNKYLENKVKERTEELEKRNKELEKTNKLTIDRELEMIKLKKEMEELRKK